MMRAATTMLLPALAALLAACAASAPPAAPEPQAPLVWPDELDVPPRIAYVRSFSRSDDFGIAPGLLKRVARIVFGAAEDRLVRPMGVTVVDGVIFVADPGATGVHRFDPVAKRYALVTGPDGTPLPSPVALASCGNGDVYVTDSALGRVLVIRPGAKTAELLPLAGLERPVGIACEPATGRLLVADAKAHVVKTFDRDGTPRGTLGTRGTGDGQFNFPTFLWRDPAGKLFVTDSLNFRVQSFDAEGRFVASIGRAGDVPGNFMRPKGVATDSYGHVYVADGLASALQVFTQDGQLLLSLGLPGQERGEFWLPEGLFVGAGDEIYVADSFNHRVQVFRYIGGPT
jgi:sugar lactone lactonase YvrE